jgi:hypothetical protein
VALAAVGLFNGDLQIAAAAGRVQIVYFKGAGRDGILISRATPVVTAIFSRMSAT